jgi:HK97 family phage major capsid protein
MENAMPPRFTPRAQWLARKNFYNLIRAIDTNGTLYARLTEGRPPELIGYPAREASAMPVRYTSSTVYGARYAILGDWSQYLIVDKAGMDIEIIPHLFSNNLPTASRGIFALWRNNAKVLVDNAFRVLVYAT